MRTRKFFYIMLLGVILNSISAYGIGASLSVTTDAVTTYDATSATMGGSLTELNISASDRGVVYNTSGTPTVGDGRSERVQMGSGAGAFSQSVTNLSAETTYYVRAYGYSSETSIYYYGETVSFTTTAVPTAPTITSTPEDSVVYGNAYSYAIAASMENELTTTLTAPTLPSWLTFNASATGAEANIVASEVNSSIMSVASDTEGNLYGMQYPTGPLYKITPDGTMTTFRSSFSNLSSIFSVEIIDGYIYLPSYASSTYSLLRFPINDPSAELETVCSVPDGLMDTEFYNGYIYGVSYSYGVIYKIDPTTKEVTTIVDTENISFYGLGLALNGDIYVVDNNTQNVYQYSQTGDLLNTYYVETYATDVCALPDGSFLVSSYESNKGIRKYNSDFSSYETISTRGNFYDLGESANGAIFWKEYGVTDIYGMQTGAMLTGTPSKSDLGVHDVVIRATNAAGYTEQEFTVTVYDNIAPEITSVVPADAATEVSVRPTLKMTFDEGISLASEGTVKIYNGESLFKTFDLSVTEDRAAFSISEDQKTLSLEITDALPSNSYIVVDPLSGFVKDSSENVYAGTIATTGFWNFTTANITAPIVTTATAADTTMTSATLGGEVTSDGGATVTERGIVYATTTTPAIGADGVTKVIMGDGTGTFSQTISSLTEGTVYYVRAYAINEIDTSYAEQMAFSTLARPTITSTPEDSVVYGNEYSYTISATEEGVLETTLSAPTLPDWLTFSSDGFSNGINLLTDITANSNIMGAAGDASGNVYVCPWSGDGIWKIAPDGSYTTWRSTLYGGEAWSLNVDDGYLYIADHGASSYSISRIPLNNPSAAQEDIFSVSNGVMDMEFSGNYIYALNYSGYLYRLDKTNNFASTTLISNLGSSACYGFGLASNGDLLIAFRNLGVIKRYNSSGSYLQEYSVGGYVSDVFPLPNGDFIVSRYGGGAILEHYNSSFSSLGAIDFGSSTSVYNLGVTESGNLVFPTYGDGKVYSMQVGAVLSGTPSKSDLGVHDVVIRATNAAGYTEQEFTVTVYDTIAPTLVNLSPVDDSINVGFRPTLEITFDEGIELGSTGTLALTTDGEYAVTYDLADQSDRSAFSVSEGGTVLSLTVDSIPEGSLVTIAVSEGFVADSSENVYAGITAQSKDWTFVVMARPQISTTPEDTVAYANNYSYPIVASIENSLETTLTAPTLPSWMTFSSGGVASEAQKITTVTDNKYTMGSAGDSEGNIYTCVWSRSGIYKVAPDGNYTLWRSSINGSDLWGLEVHDGYLYLCDHGNATYSVTRIPLNAPEAAEETMLSVSGGIMDIEFVDDDFYALSMSGNVLYKVNVETKAVETIINSGLNNPYGFDIDSEGNFIIANTEGSSILKYSSDGTFVETLAQGIYACDIVVVGDQYLIGHYTDGIRLYNSDFTSYEQIDEGNQVYQFGEGAGGSILWARYSSGEVYALQAGAMVSGTPSKSDLGVHNVVVRATNDAGFTEQAFTVTVIDTIKPEVTSLSPANEAYTIGLNPTLAVTFDEGVALADEGTLKVYAGQELHKTYDLEVAADRDSIKLSEDQRTISVYLSDTLPEGTIIGIDVTEGFVVDSSRNESVGTSDKIGQWLFKTASRPSFISTPEDSVAYDDVYAYRIDVSLEDTMLTYVTADDLPDWLLLQKMSYNRADSESSYILSGMPSKADVGEHEITLKASNSFGYTEQTFTIEVIDTIAPTLVSLSPADDSINVGFRPTLEITLDEGIELGTTGTLALTTDGEYAVTYDLSDQSDRSAFSVSEDGTVLSLTVDSIPEGSLVTIAVSEGLVADSSANVNAGITAQSKDWTFVVMARPQISTTPEDTVAYANKYSYSIIASVEKQP